jgi:hypothetical protein
VGIGGRGSENHLWEIDDTVRRVDTDTRNAGGGGGGCKNGTGF